MNCRQVNKLLDRYVDGKTSDREKNLINEHIEVCKKCGNSFLRASALKEALMQKGRGFLAPENFTGIVMDEVIRTSVKTNENTGVSLESYRMAIRRLGISMVLTAAVMMINTGLPGGGLINHEKLNQGLDSVSSITERVGSNINEINYKFANIFRDLNDSIESQRRNR